MQKRARRYAEIVPLVLIRKKALLDAVYVQQEVRRMRLQGHAEFVQEDSMRDKARTVVSVVLLGNTQMKEQKNALSASLEPTH